MTRNAVLRLRLVWCYCKVNSPLSYESLVNLINLNNSNKKLIVDAIYDEFTIRCI